jgi:hypothetical protein
MKSPTRRQVLIAGAGGLLGGAVALGFRSRRPLVPVGNDASPAAPIPVPRELRALTTPEYLTLAAASERVFPRGESPGAIDLGVPLYVDRCLLAAPAPPWVEGFRSGLSRLDAVAASRFATPFHQATVESQDAIMIEWADDEEESDNRKFLQNLVVATLEGALGDPTYGGNVDAKGWESMGMPRDPFVPSTRAKQ